MTADILHLHSINGGATYHPNFGNLAGQRLWAVAPYIERGMDVPGQTIRAQDLTAFIAVNADLLDDPRHSVGTWYNSEDDHTYLDIVLTISDENAAIETAEQANQIAIYNLASNTVLFTGGTGKME